MTFVRVVIPLPGLAVNLLKRVRPSSRMAKHAANTNDSYNFAEQICVSALHTFMKSNELDISQGILVKSLT